ncbi:MAG: tetratricopeptide repeat protein [Sphingomonadales bacterium]|nr:tetratricopeptide repeat protein [Sphingomonadales bacterium]
MKRILLLSTILLTGLSYAQTLQQAIGKTENERYLDAIADYKKLVAADPINGDNYFYFGDCYFEKEEIDSAKMMWKKGYEVDKLRALPLVGYGRVLWLEGKTTEAEAEFTKALLMTKKNKLKKAEVIRGIAEIYIEAPNKNIDKALILLEEAILKDPTNEDNYLLKGDALYARNSSDASEALKAYNQVLVLNPKSPRGIVRKALIYQRAKNEPEANKMYNEAKTIDPTYAPAYRLNAELYLMFGKNKQAIENWEKYLELNNNTESRYRYANALFAAKEYTGLLSQLEVLKNSGFSNFYTERMFAFAYAESTDSLSLVNALNASNRFFAIVPADKINYQDYKVRGNTYQKQGKDSLAIIEFEKAASINDISYKELSNELIKLYTKNKMYDKLISAYELRRQKNGKLQAQEEYELGKAYYFGRNDYKTADSIFQVVIKNDSTYVPGYIYRGRANYKMDTNNEKWLAFPYYFKVTEIVKPEDRTQPSKKAFVLESLRYVADYYSKSPAKDLDKAKSFFEQILQVEPNDQVAKKALGIKDPAPATTPGSTPKPEAPVRN